MTFIFSTTICLKSNTCIEFWPFLYTAYVSVNATNFEQARINALKSFDIISIKVYAQYKFNISRAAENNCFL